MNKLKELFDQLKDVLMVRWEQFQETDTYISLRDRYDNLSARNQKIAIFSVFVILFLMIFMIPYSWLNESRDSVTQFEETKSTIQELLQVSQDAKSLPPQTETVSAADIKSRVDKALAEKGISKDQIVSVSEGQFTNPTGSNLIPAQILASGLEVNLKKLNLKQLVDLGYEFDHISPLVKILNLNVSANKDDVHYYDAAFRVASFTVKDMPKPGDAKKGAAKGRQ